MATSHKTLRAFLTLPDLAGERLPDNLLVALLKVHAGMGRKEVELHVPIDTLLKGGWVEFRNRRLYLKPSLKEKLGLNKAPGQGPDPRVAELVRAYRESGREVLGYDLRRIHEYGGLAKAAKKMLMEITIHPKLKTRTREEQLQGLKRIVRAMFYTEDNYDRNFFASRKWHLAAFDQKLFAYLSQMVEVQRQKEKTENQVTGRETL